MLTTQENKTISWGIVGAGNVCEHKGGPPLYQCPGHQLVGIHRRDRAKGEDYARRHGPCRFIPSYEEMLADPSIDAIYVATPPVAHAAQTIAAAAAGKHVLVEKPMAMQASECATMIQACQKHGVTLAVAYYRRGYPTVQTAKKWIDEGVIGTLQRIHLNDQFPPSHRLDLVHYFAGEMATVRTVARDGAVIFHGVTQNGVAVEMNLGWGEKPGVPEQVRLQGDQGELFIDDLKGGSVSGTRSQTFPPLPWTHWGLVENFGRALAGQEALLCDGEEGRKSTVVLDFASALVADEAAVAVDYENPPEPNLNDAGKLNLLG